MYVPERDESTDHQSLDQQIEKNSPTLSRMAHYEQYVSTLYNMYTDNRKSRLSRLPEYLAVHMVSR